MASQDLKHRPKQETQPDPPPKQTQSPAADKKPRKSGRGLLSLTVAVAFPIVLTLLVISLFGAASRKPFYFPPLWALHSACLASASLSGLSAWLVWADGGFHRRPSALGLYLGQLLLSLAWYPVVLGAGASRVGLVLCGALFGVLVGCARAFGNVNPIAGDLVKPCLAWAVLMAVLNVRLACN